MATRFLISLAALLVPRYGTLGASYAVLGGNVVATVMRCWIYQRVLKEDA